MTKSSPLKIRSSLSGCDKQEQRSSIEGRSCVVHQFWLYPEGSEDLSYTAMLQRRFGRWMKQRKRLISHASQPFKVIHEKNNTTISKLGAVVFATEEFTEARKPENIKNEDVGAVPLDGLYFNDKLQFVEEPIEITDREVKR
ncbi:hypothetical protein Tco_0140239 [Tanacetum coccineum]